MAFAWALSGGCLAFDFEVILLLIVFFTSTSSTNSITWHKRSGLLSAGKGVCVVFKDLKISLDFLVLWHQGKEQKVYLYSCSLLFFASPKKSNKRKEPLA